MNNIDNINTLRVIGPFNTGNNLCKQILLQNSSGHKWISTNSLELWKHCCNKEKLKEIIKNNKENLFIIMYKSLPFWIYSIKKMPYSIVWDKNNINSQCEMNINNHSEYNRVTFKNIAELHKQYYEIYMYLINKYDNVIFLNYHKLINRNNIYKYLSDNFNKYNITFNENIKYVLDRPSKVEGNPVRNSNEAILRSNKIIDSINNNSVEKNFILKNLDEKIINFFEK